MTIVTFPELWSELKKQAEAAVLAAKTDLIPVERVIAPIVEKDLVILLNQLLTIAIQAVLSIAVQSLSGHEKMSSVTTTIFQHAEANAIAISLSDAQLLAQQAYTAIAASAGR